MWQRVPEQVRRAKSTVRHRWGDLYEPRHGATDEHAYGSYRAPRRDHVHADNGRREMDVARAYYHGRRFPFLLAGDSRRSFVWDQPRIALPVSRPLSPMPSGQALEPFIEALHERV
jgi:hypothetical protein